MVTFVLVHGAWHGAWCWDAVSVELGARGHASIAMDLPIEDVHATFVDYAEVVLEAMPQGAEDVVLVGHSMAGQTIPLVAAQRPVRRLVYLAALGPVPGSSLDDVVKTEGTMVNPEYFTGVTVDEQKRTHWSDSGVARQILYADCDPGSAAEVFARLRPQASTPYLPPMPLKGYPDVPATYIVCKSDKLVNPEWSRTFARDRMGADVVEIPGSHEPFLARPDELAELLHALV